MKFAIKFCDIQQNLESLRNILKDVKSDIIKIFVIFDGVEEKWIRDNEKKKKYVNKCEKILQKINSSSGCSNNGDGNGSYGICGRGFRKAGKRNVHGEPESV